MKVALCFIISYEHILNKEEIWKTWIESNKDIINVYFYYKDINKILTFQIKFGLSKLLVIDIIMMLHE